MEGSYIVCPGREPGVFHWVFGMGSEMIHYKRSRFSAQLPITPRYTRSHWWLDEEAPGLWRVGLTRFATRMLGELVEWELRPTLEADIELGQSLGWIEGFKALSEIYAVGVGRFGGSNPKLSADPTLLDREPHGAGWLYRLAGRPDPDAMDAVAYIAVLDATIDKMLAKPPEARDDRC